MCMYLYYFWECCPYSCLLLCFPRLFLLPLLSAPDSRSVVCRYYICDRKLAALGWSEKTTWENGLNKTINWYMENGFSERWVGDVDSALAAHPKAQ